MNKFRRFIEQRIYAGAKKNPGIFSKPGQGIFEGGATRNRTKDTRIFSPLLYLLSYGTLKKGLQRYEKLKIKN